VEVGVGEGRAGWDGMGWDGGTGERGGVFGQMYVLMDGV